MAAALTAGGVAGVMGALGSITRTDAIARDSERLQRLAFEKLDELLATGEYATNTEGDFTDRGQSKVAWKVETNTTGIENLGTVTVTVTSPQGRKEEAETLVYERPEQSGGTTP